jgi:hypothetical protein
MGAMSMSGHSLSESKAGTKQCEQDGMGAMSMSSHSHSESKTGTKAM